MPHPQQPHEVTRSSLPPLLQPPPTLAPSGGGGIVAGVKTTLTILFALCVLGCGNMEEAEKSDENSSAGLKRSPFRTVTLYDFNETREWAEKGNADQQTRLGEMYEKGKGVAKDSKEAIKWFQKAADQGNADAQFNLGVMYRVGKGVEKDSKEAVKWFEKAADQMHANAQSTLGYMYRDGKGVEKDSKEAVKWFSIYAANDPNTEIQIGRFSKAAVSAKMTPEQIAKAQELSAEMIKKNPKLLK